LLRLEELEGVRFEEFNIRESVQFGISCGASQRVTRRVERGYAVSTCREVNGKRAVVAEAVERSTSRACAGGDAILALVEKGAGLLSLPGSGEIARAMFHDLDFTRDIAREQLDVRREAFLHPQWNVIARED